MIPIEVITGVVDTVFPIERYGNFEKRVIWVSEQNAKYPQMWAVELWHDNVMDCNQVDEGRVISFTVEIRGKQFGKGEKLFVTNILRCISMTRF